MIPSSLKIQARVSSQTRIWLKVPRRGDELCILVGLSLDARFAINEERERVVGIFIVWLRNFEKNLEERKRKGKEGKIMSG